LVERISELEEEIRNLRRLHLTIERNSRLFEALLAASQDGITLTRLDGTIIRTVRPILGYGAADVSGKPVCDFVHPDDREIMRQAYRRIREDGQRQSDSELRLLGPCGSSVWVRGTITDMLDNPAVQAIVHNYRNVTEIKAGEMAAAELAAVIRHAPFAIFSKTIAGQILSWNGGAREMYGYEPEEIVGRHISELVPLELRDEEQHYRSIAIQQRTATPRIRTVRIRKDGTSIPVDLVLSPILSAGRIEGVAHLAYPL